MLKNPSDVPATSKQMGEHLQNTCATDRCEKVRQLPTDWVHSLRFDTQPRGMYAVVGGFEVVAVVDGVGVEVTAGMYSGGAARTTLNFGGRAGSTGASCKLCPSLGSNLIP